jgi:hypothetical protein
MTPTLTPTPTPTPLFKVSWESDTDTDTQISGVDPNWHRHWHSDIGCRKIRHCTDTDTDTQTLGVTAILILNFVFLVLAILHCHSYKTYIEDHSSTPRTCMRLKSGKSETKENRPAISILFLAEARHNFEIHQFSFLSRSCILIHMHSIWYD